jgi:hypothetical protein
MLLDALLEGFLQLLELHCESLRFFDALELFHRRSLSFEALPLVAHCLHHLLARKATESRNAVDLLVVLFSRIDHSTVERIALDSGLADRQARCFY